MASALARLRASSWVDRIGLALVGLVVLWLLVNFFKGPVEFINVGIIGLTNGAIYGVVALGYTLVYGILQLINFAHGDVFALSGLFASTVIVSVLGLDTDSSVPVDHRRDALHARRRDGRLRSLQRDDRARRVQAAPPRASPRAADHGGRHVVHRPEHRARVLRRRLPLGARLHPRARTSSTSAAITITWNKLAAIMIVVPLLLLLSWFVRHTKQGKAMRAVAQDREASAMMGIDVNRTISVTFLIAGALAAAAGLVYLLQFNMRYDTGFELGLIAFTAAVLGGIGNLTGAVLGALIIGFVQAFNEGLTWFAPGSDWTRTGVFGILILILVFRPEGLLGERTPEGA